ncbi:HAD hydrolase-like protein [Kocuria sp.]|jgi:phosphoglycolate phosphatase|uniref:HAD hydrolase-like protein n=1 Tax=Kocuria sp. TaxID=1871328 RepID=UPI0028111CBD|nr:HAD hydrolase-like protein [Kocuria sp.]HST70982.1 HAD hydrolase-like protein [Kocuria rosea]
MSAPVVLWDLDGTVLDPAGAITGGIARALAERGHPVPEDLRRFVGPPVGVSLRAFTDVPEEEIPHVVAAYRARYRTEGLAQTRIYPGVEELLASLHAAGVRMAVATQKPEPVAELAVERFGLGRWFETVSGAADDLAAPHARTDLAHDKPAIIGEALRRLGVHAPDPARTVMVGDRRYDAEGAAAHGLDCLGVAWGFAAEDELGHGFAAVAGDAAELAGLLAPYTSLAPTGR